VRRHPKDSKRAIIPRPLVHHGSRKVPLSAQETGKAERRFRHKRPYGRRLLTLFQPRC